MKTFFRIVVARLVLMVVVGLILAFLFHAPEWAAIGFGLVYGVVCVPNDAV